MSEPSDSENRIKRIIESEKDPKILQALLVQAAGEIERLSREVERLKKEEAQGSQTNFTLEESVRLLRKALYGRSREERPEASDRPRSESQETALLFSQSAFPAPEMHSEGKGKSKGRELEMVEIDIRATDEELCAESRIRGLSEPSAAQWIDTGLFDQSTKIQIIERRYVREIHRRFKYKLKPQYAPGSEKEIIITANAQSALLPGMNYTTEFVASVVADKYVSHMPLERQTREMESLGLKSMKTSTLSRLSALAAVTLEPLAEEVRSELVKTDLALHLDETPWKIQDKKEQDGYMWVISNRHGSYYFFKPTRSGQVLKEKLGDYNGPALTDGFGGYNVLEELQIKQGFCWAHARREFIPLESHDPTVKPILDLMDKIFEYEREATSLEDLKRIRDEKSRKAIAELHALLMVEHPRSRPSSQKRKAIEYSLKRWAGLTFFLEDLRLPISNNEAERTIRHAVMGRKNYYGSGNHEGANTAATLFTIIESAKKNDLDPRTFLLMSLDRAARGEELETPLSYARRTRQPV